MRLGHRLRANVTQDGDRARQSDGSDTAWYCGVNDQLQLDRLGLKPEQGRLNSKR